MNYLHISMGVFMGFPQGPGRTHNVGRNAAKRASRAGKPRKRWPTVTGIVRPEKGIVA